MILAIHKAVGERWQISKLSGLAARLHFRADPTARFLFQFKSKFCKPGKLLLSRQKLNTRPIVTSDDQHKAGEVIFREFELLEKRDRRRNVIVTVALSALAALILWLAFVLAWNARS